MSPHGSASTLAPAIILWVPFQNVSFGSKADIALRPRLSVIPSKRTFIADKRTNDGGAERAGAACHHHMPVPIVHHSSRWFGGA
jgi:hypothetical protein